MFLRELHIIMRLTIYIAFIKVQTLSAYTEYVYHVTAM